MLYFLDVPEDVKPMTFQLHLYFEKHKEAAGSLISGVRKVSDDSSVVFGKSRWELCEPLPIMAKATSLYFAKGLKDTFSFFTKYQGKSWEFAV